ncbi:hypothetical protein pdam_00009029 [Pocillopora damicornis]|uniref:G-protein coupled receptors family 1 profile domain-containing protein n=1 Tax=Pocillopora damicornis TaxID=46731 RepID=A0A3M6T9D7_POCDA|nr:hypothetical protein pdam_00009029 [Pocillopora damicornis]
MDNLQQLQNHVSAENSSKTIARNELAPHSPWGPMTIIIASFLVVVICLATVGNLVVCRLVWVCRRMQIPSLYFVASMSFSDFLTGLLVLPLSLGYHISYQNTGRWTFGRFTCDLYLFLNFILLLHDNETNLYWQKSSCQTNLEALKKKQEAIQFSRFKDENPLEQWVVCSLPNLYFGRVETLSSWH